MGAAEIHERTASDATMELAFHNIAAFVDGSEADDLVVAHALAMARAFGGRLTLAGVIQDSHASDAPTEALDWDIRRREAQEQLDQLVRRYRDDVPLSAEVIEGRGAEQIYQWAQHHQIDLTVIGSCRDAEGSAGCTLANAGRTLIDQIPGSVLVVHFPAAPETAAGRYRRVLVPVDGSLRAESVLPLAVRLAGSTAAELIIAHVVPGAGLTEIGPLDSEDVDLRERITRRNERVAAAYLDRLRARLAAGGAAPRVTVLHDGDVRTHLEQLIQEEAVDLVVLSSHGHSGRTKVPYGSVTAELVTHTSVPLLIVRSRAVCAHLTTPTECVGRLPHQARS